MITRAKLLELPNAARYALAASALLAREEPWRYRRAGEMARELSLSGSLLAKVLQRLVRGGLLESRRGREGGHRLARPAGAVSLAEIIAAAAPARSEPARCLVEPKTCGSRVPCGLRSMLARSERLAWDGFARTRLDRFSAARRAPGR